nr:M48 family metalloprotease [Sphaerisporangium rubeum]
MAEFVFAILLYALHPPWIIRRSRLTPLNQNESPDLIGELNDLSRQAGLSRPPRWLLAPYSASATGQVFGTFLRHQVRLDAGLVTRFIADRPGFRAVVLHELAHLRNRDVGRTYATIALWRAFIVTAVVPFAVMMLQPGLVNLPWNWKWSVPLLISDPIDTSYWLTLVASTALLIYMIRNAIFRTREVHADAMAAALEGQGEILPRVIVALPLPSTRRWRTSFSPHPWPGVRLATIKDPGRLTRIRLWEMVGAGLAAGLLTRSLGFAISVVMLEKSLTATMLSAVPAGALMAGLLAAGLYRATAGATLWPGPHAWLAPAAMLAVGFVIGNSLEPAGTSDGWAHFGLAFTAVRTLATVLLLLVGGLLLTGWIISTARIVASDRRVSNMTIVIAAVTAAPCFSIWFAVDRSGGFWKVTPGPDPFPGASIAWYAKLSHWTQFSNSALLGLELGIPTVAAVLTLWLGPILVSRHQSANMPLPRIGRAMAVGFCAGLIVVALGVGLTFLMDGVVAPDARGYIPSDDLIDSGSPPFFGLIWRDSYTMVATLGLATAAAATSVVTTRLRPALVLLSISTAGIIAVLGRALTWTTAFCIDLFNLPGTQCQAPVLSVGSYTSDLQVILARGLLAAIPATLVATGIGRILRQHRTVLHGISVEQPTYQTAWPRHITVLVALIVLSLVLAVIVNIPANIRFWM